MDKKRFDHIEEDMRTAAEGWEPPFDEKAWDHMERMLEGENDRKRPVAWWMWLLPLLLLIGVAGYFILKNDQPQPTVIATAQHTVMQKDNSPSEDQSDKEKATAAPVDITGINTDSADLKNYTNLQGNNAAAMRMKVISPSVFNDQPVDNNAGKTGKISDQQKGKMKMSVNAAMAVADDKQKEDTKDDENKNTEPATTIVNTLPTAIPELKKEEAIKEATKKDPVTDQSKEKENSPAKNKKEKEQQGKSSKFYFSLFAGMEGNGVNFPGLNKVSPRAGFMAGYNLTKKLSVQAGFFAGSKKYVAGKYDYNPKPGTYWSMVDIQSVDANCRVFEIPLSVRYDFSPAKKWNTFLSGGLSSYIMDKEDYAYDYIRNNTPYHAKASYTGNQHFFSVLRVSGGIETKLSKQFSIGINPGLAIPLAGVGEGQIKLFSSELLLNLKYRPFKRSK